MTSLASVLDAFGLALRSTSELQGGLETQGWRVATQRGHFAVRRLPAQTVTAVQLQAELAWLETLAAESTVVVPRPKRLIDQDAFTFVERGSNGEALAFWTTLNWIEGKTLGRLPSEQQAVQIGRAIAKMHQVADNQSHKTLSGLGERRYDAKWFESAATALLANRCRDHQITITAGLRQALVQLAELARHAEMLGPIHADLHDGNLLWSDHHDMPHIIDFGRLGLGPFALDLAIAQYYVADSLGDLMQDGYCRVRSLSELELDALPLLRLLAWIGNLAMLSRYEKETVSVANDMPQLAAHATALAEQA